MRKIKSFKLFESGKTRIEMIEEVKSDIESILYEFEEDKIIMTTIYLDNKDRFGRPCNNWESTFHIPPDGDGNAISLLVLSGQNPNMDLFGRFLRLLKDHLDYIECGEERIGMGSPNKVGVKYTIDLRGYLKKLGW